MCVCLMYVRGIGDNTQIYGSADEFWLRANGRRVGADQEIDAVRARSTVRKAVPHLPKGVRLLCSLGA
jgi:hypothetical protein